MKKQGQKNEVEKAKKVETKVQVAGAPELVVTSASDKGVSCVVRNVRLTWVFVKNFREDKTDWRKGQKSVTLLIPKKGVGAFQKALADAVKQTISLNKKIVEGQEKIEAYKIALAVDKNSSLLKDGDNATDAGGNARQELAGFLTWQIKKSAYRENKNEEFAEKFPLILRTSAGAPIEDAFIDREFYSGVVCDVAFALSTYSVNGKSGVTAYLNGLRKVRDGERLGGHDPFAGVPAVAVDSGFSDDEILL